MTLQERLREVLDSVLQVREEGDGALTVQHDGTLASLRVVSVAEGLELISLSQSWPGICRWTGGFGPRSPNGPAPRCSGRSR